LALRARPRGTRQPGLDQHGGEGRRSRRVRRRKARYGRPARRDSLRRMSVTWTAAAEYEDIRYELSGDGIAKITIDRPEVRNAFRRQTVVELSEAVERAGEDPSVGVVGLTGEGPLAFCSGGDQRVRGDSGYLSEPGREGAVGRFHVTDLHVQIRRLPKPV